MLIIHRLNTLSSNQWVICNVLSNGKSFGTRPGADFCSLENLRNHSALLSDRR